MTHASHPQLLQPLADDWLHFAAMECTQDPLYVAICRLVAQSPELLSLCLLTRPEQRRPNLLLAAIHERVLLGVSHALCDYFPSVGGQRAPDAGLATALHDFVAQQQEPISAHLRSSHTQTNEIGRCAVLWPVLAHIAQAADGAPLALLDVGSSAGLNLGVDAYTVSYQREGGEWLVGGEPCDDVAQVRCDLRGDGNPLDRLTDKGGAWRLTHRLGLDPLPVDVHDAQATRWLQACVWPCDTVRQHRLRLALDMARQRSWPVQQTGPDSVDAILAWLDSLPGDVQPVVLNSWVLCYFSDQDRAHHEQAMVDLVRERGAVWVSAEAPSLRPTDMALPATPPNDPKGATLWCQVSHPAGEVRQRALAWSHPHGAWLQWLEQAM
ncbi:MAG: DUF2332 domain-containing protein [Rhodoferax sp.]|nr:DUF2332 domain-containing protein [Rhodoferax sp.]